MTSRLSLPPRARTRCWTTWGRTRRRRSSFARTTGIPSRCAGRRSSRTARSSTSCVSSSSPRIATRPALPTASENPRRGVAPTRPSARRSAHSPPAFLPPRVAGLGRRTLRHPQGGSRPQSREGRRREDGRRAMTKTATAKQATIEDGGEDRDDDSNRRFGGGYDTID